MEKPFANGLQRIDKFGLSFWAGISFMWLLTLLVELVASVDHIGTVMKKLLSDVLNRLEPFGLGYWCSLLNVHQSIHEIGVS